MASQVLRGYSKPGVRKSVCYFFAWTTTDKWFKVCWPVKNKICHMTLFHDTCCTCSQYLFVGCAERYSPPPPPREIRKIENWIWLALIREHIHSPLLHHEKTTLKVVKKISRFDGSYFTVSIPWHIVYIKRREKKNTQSKKSYKAGNNSGKSSQFLQELSIFLHRKSPFQVAACRMDFHISCPLWSF